MNKPVATPYSTSADQHYFEVVPREGELRGTVVLIHGGYWRSALGASLMDPLARSLRDGGWLVFNLEYRRGSEGPWPAPIEDCRAAIQQITSSAPPRPLVSIGHSVGGQLALLAGDLVDAVVALAPVTDVARTYTERGGDDAAQEYFGVSPAEAPEIYREASPLCRAPGNRPVLVVHGQDDDRVPVEHSRAYVAGLRTSETPVEYREFQDLSHLAQIDPQAVHWEGVVAWMNGIGSAS